MDSAQPRNWGPAGVAAFVLPLPTAIAAVVLASAGLSWKAAIVLLLLPPAAAVFTTRTFPLAARIGLISVALIAAPFYLLLAWVVLLVWVAFGA